MTALKLADGTWGVFNVGETAVPVAGPFATLAEAWRWIDRHEGDPVSRSEKVSEFIWSKGLGGCA